MWGPGRFGRIDVKACALAEIIGRVVRDIVAARAGVRRHEDQAQFGTGAAILALVGDVRVRAGQA